jgi:hypothetical protein
MPITNTTIAQQISDLVDKWQLREDEMINWLAGTVTGGPTSNGKYPLTDVLGVITLVDCPAKMQDTVDNTVSGAGASATAAALSAADALLSKNAAATSATNAATSATNAAASAATATTAKNNALNSETNAGVHATNAAASATSAATSATNAAASYDSFDDRYLGSKASAPTLDNDGAALLLGALYWDTGLSGLRAWNGSAWITYAGITAAGLANTPAGNIAATNVQAAINELDTEKAPLASPTFTGNPLAPTPAQFDNDTTIATTQFVNAVGLKATHANPSYGGDATLNTSAAGVSAVYAGGGGHTITLPLSSTMLNGSTISMRNSGAGLLTLVRQGSDVISACNQTGVTFIVLGPGESIILTTIGTGTWLEWTGMWQYGLSGDGITAYTASATLTTANFRRLNYYNSATAGTLTLPAANSVKAGAMIAFANINAGALTVARTSTNVIYARGQSAATSIVLQKGDSLILTTDTGSWIEVASSTSIGVGQSWQDVTASRASSTTYTNSTGKPITVHARCFMNITDNAVLATIGGVAQAVSGTQASANLVSVITFVVPVGSTYKIDPAYGSATINMWTELR